MFFKSKQHPSLLHPWLTSCSCWVRWEQFLSPHVSGCLSRAQLPRGARLN